MRYSLRLRAGDIIEDRESHRQAIVVDPPAQGRMTQIRMLDDHTTHVLLDANRKVFGVPSTWFLVEEGN